MTESIEITFDDKMLFGRFSMYISVMEARELLIKARNKLPEDSAGRQRINDYLEQHLLASKVTV